MKNNNENVVPIVSYHNADINKHSILNNKGKSGIYRWNNLITYKSYIGSSIFLRGRFSNYYSIGFLNNKVKRGTSIIYNALLKYGYLKFSLDIIEYCEINVLIEREQYYIDRLKPEYYKKRVLVWVLDIQNIQKL